ncbi:MAG: TIM barrel protein [Desulfobacterales bacterium]|nr:TIM barrel protein [Desulfobacterales bacterium]
MIKIGPAGSEGLGNLAGVRKVARMQLDCMEVAFTYGVRMSVRDARQVGVLAKDNGIVLSVHAPYYINLASDEKEKIQASKKRILDSCQRAHALGAKNVVFHAGFYQKKSAEKTYVMVKKAIREIQRRIKNNRWKVTLCPEVTGKASQFGSIEELLSLKKETGCGICVDFAHLYARDQGKVDYGKILKKLPKKFHAHFSGIAFGPKGERKHLKTTKKFFEPLALALLKHKVDITLICESPQPYKDAAMMKKVLTALADR